MAKTREQLDDARRQGQFEGQVLTTLADIKGKMEGITQTTSGMDARIRNTETTLVAHAELFKDSDRAHQDTDSRLSTVTTTIENLVASQNKFRGFLIAAGTIGPILASVITALILKALTGGDS